MSYTSRWSPEVYDCCALKGACSPSDEEYYKELIVR
jgi:hypothetical protein